MTLRYPELAGGSSLLEVERAVEDASRLLRGGRQHAGAIISKGARDFATQVDVEAERVVRARLRTLAPDIPFLGEESHDTAVGPGAMWILDPIDGTVNFARGSPLCGISLALVEDGQPRLAVVDFPFLCERYVAVEGTGAFRNGHQIATTQRPLAEAVVGVTDFSVGHDAPTENPLHTRVISSLAARALRVRVHGSEALDLAWLAAGRLDAAIMLASRPWDVSAGVLLVREAGGAVMDLGGEPHAVTAQSTIACTHAIAEPLQAILAACRR